MSRQSNIQVFEDTMRLCRENPDLKNAIAKSIQEQRLYLGENDLNLPFLSIFNQDCQVIVSQKRTFEAAALYARQPGFTVAVHNFASASNPGGGVIHGSNAQEEALCRCSTLYPALKDEAMWEGFYLPHRAARNPLHNDDCIHTPGIVVFKSDTEVPALLPENEWYRVNVVTCAAPNLRKEPANLMNPGDLGSVDDLTDAQLQALHESRLRRILTVMANHHAQVAILGAFGCGAFRNPPEVAAAAAAKVLPAFRKTFRVIEFAVFCRPGDSANHDAFHTALAHFTK